VFAGAKIRLNVNCKSIFKNKKMALANYIRDIQGFPKEGILFKDITLLIDPKATKECLKSWFHR
jgi:adenine/guanine phosphoribosyltransferase-like PRPP-binding protein